jgi:Cu2+-exporting ATPase
LTNLSHHNHEIEKNIDDSEHKKMNHKMTENGQHHDHHAIMEQDFKRRFYVSLVITAPILLLSPTIQTWFNFTIPRFTGYGILLFALATVIALYGGWPFYKGAYRDLQQGMLGMMVLVSISVGTGYLFSVASTFILVDTMDFYWEISTLVVFLLFGHWMEMRMTRRATGALQELVKLIPPTANLFKDGEVVEIMTSQVKVGDVLLIHPGEKVR